MMVGVAACIEDRYISCRQQPSARARVCLQSRAIASLPRATLASHRQRNQAWMEHSSGPWRRTLLWGAALLIAGLFEAQCGYTRYDHRASSRLGCTVLREAAAKCYEPEAPCIDTSTIQTLSPRWLGSLSGNGGPLLTWAPLLLSAQQPGRVRAVLAHVLLWYLSLIGVVRHAHLITGGWDPSGHVFVIGAQLLPVWQLREAGNGSKWQRMWLAVWLCALAYLSLATAAFFHTLTETAAGWGMVLLLVSLLHRTAGESERSSSSSSAGGTAAASAAAGGSRLLADNVASLWTGTGGVCRLSVAIGLWIGATAIGWSDDAASPRAILAGQLAYDCVLWLCLIWIVMRPSARAEDEAHGLCKNEQRAPADG